MSKKYKFKDFIKYYKEKNDDTITTCVQQYRWETSDYRTGE